MIQIIPFSFNRAMQLDTLLSSLLEHWKSPDFHVDVIYNSSSEKFEEGYIKLKKEYLGNNISFHKESSDMPDRVSLKEIANIYNAVRLWRSPRQRHPRTDFRKLLINLMENSASENVMFLTDDAMFISDIEIPQKEIEWINEFPQNRQFSLRLGKGHKKLPEGVVEDGNYCQWDMYENKGHWGYPFSVDAHIYNKKCLLDLFRKYLFHNPSTFEGYILGNIRRRKLLSEGRCFKDIKMLSFPINIVQTTVDNLSQNVSVEMLNNRYLKGEHMRYVINKEYDADKQYVKQLEFTDMKGNTTILDISNDLVRLNSDC